MRQGYANDLNERDKALIQTQKKETGKIRGGGELIPTLQQIDTKTVYSSQAKKPTTPFTPH